MYNNGFKYYALTSGGIQGAYKVPVNHAYKSKEAAFKISTFCLEGYIPGTYRLLARYPTTINTYHHFKIKCPDCGGTLEPIMPAKDKHVLPMYACTCCNR